MPNLPAPSTERSSQSTQTAPCTNASAIAEQARKSRLSVPRPEIPKSDDGGGLERFSQGVVPTSGGTKFDQLLWKNESKTLWFTPLEGTQHYRVSGPKSVFNDLLEQANGEDDGSTIK